MKISDLNEMEKIVEQNPSLSWDGWSVVYLEKDDNARMKKEAAFLNSGWHKKMVYENKNGFWNIPDSVLRKGNV